MSSHPEDLNHYAVFSSPDAGGFLEGWTMDFIGQEKLAVKHFAEARRLQPERHIILSAVLFETVAHFAPVSPTKTAIKLNG
jgi:hypothetical protein